MPVLLERMHDTILLINRGKPDQAYTKAVAIQQDFPDSSRGRLIQEVGLLPTAQRLDAAYRTSLADETIRALERKDIPHLQKAVYSIAFLLILEKLDRLELLMQDAGTRVETRAAVLAVAHDYFTHMFERLLRFRAPEQIKALDRLLDRMAVAVKRGDAAALGTLRAQFLNGLVEGFQDQLVVGKLKPILDLPRGGGS
ncbi:MAG: hypothetical protein HY581_02630 [Nitrospirae bacterium]|nr:hypothetical protein [Nitrospirota bacterium]